MSIPFQGHFAADSAKAGVNPRPTQSWALDFSGPFMSPIFLALFLGVLLLNLAPRLFPRRGKRRPVFRQSGVLPGPLAEGLLHSLITDRGRFRADTHIAGFIGEAPMVERSGGCGRLVLYPAPAHGRESDLDGIKRLAHHGFKGPRPTLVVIGGSAAFGEAAFCASAPLRALHIDDLGQVRERRDRFRSTAPRLAVEAALDDMAGSLREGTLPQIGTELARRLAFEDAASPGTARPPALITLSLTAAILLCFALQVATSRDSLWGSGASFAVVYRMGGLYRESILAGEWQRLIAAPFLHFGLVHLAMNGWAQGSSLGLGTRSSTVGGTPYRITAVGWGRRPTTQVMLQSVYVKP